MLTLERSCHFILMWNIKVLALTVQKIIHKSNVSDRVTYRMIDRAKTICTPPPTQPPSISEPWKGFQFTPLFCLQVVRGPSVWVSIRPTGVWLQAFCTYFKNLYTTSSLDTILNLDEESRPFPEGGSNAREIHQM